MNTKVKKAEYRGLIEVVTTIISTSTYMLHELQYEEDKTKTETELTLHAVSKVVHLQLMDMINDIRKADQSGIDCIQRDGSIHEARMYALNRHTKSESLIEEEIHWNLYHGKKKNCENQETGWKNQN
ncbi:hypothetical protein DINM_005753 [Dirofilaria immitis]|nr:hypothetical protein [Dirofilaria immitis]MCP9262784.1 hypothetical protein [Dirofilaria immitis]